MKAIIISCLLGLSILAGSYLASEIHTTDKVLEALDARINSFPQAYEVTEISFGLDSLNSSFQVHNLDLTSEKLAAITSEFDLEKKDVKNIYFQVCKYDTDKNLVPSYIKIVAVNYNNATRDCMTFLTDDSQEMKVVFHGRVRGIIDAVLKGFVFANPAKNPIESGVKYRISRVAFKG